MTEWIGLAECALRAIHPRLPLVDAARCVARHEVEERCSRCASVCPRTAIGLSPGPVVDGAACDGCGACAAACPTGAIEIADIGCQLQAWLARAAVMPSGRAGVACDRAPSSSLGDGWPVAVVPCLAGLRPADLVAAAARSAVTVTLTSADCANCERAAAATTIVQTIAIARDALAALGSPMVIERVTLDARRPVQRPGGPIVSRRALFGMARERARRVAIEVARSTETESERVARGGYVPAWRQRLEADLVVLGRAGRTTGALLPSELGTADPVVVGPCDGCALCTLACPLHALSDDVGTIRVDGASCTACGVCAHVCPTAALVVRPRDVASLWEQERAIVAATAPAANPISSERLTERATAAERRMRDAAARQLLRLPGRGPA